MHDQSGPSSPTDTQTASHAAPSLPSPNKGIHDFTIDIDDMSSCTSSSDDSDDDEDGGVFFGKHSEAESRFLANVSRTTPRPSPSPPSKRNRRQSRLVSRLRKDSTEFHRRKTILHLPVPVDEDDQQEEDDMQERYQREISVLQISPSVLASARKPSLISPSRSLCTILDQLHVTGSPLPDASSEGDSSSTIDFSDCSIEGSNRNADSDKENLQCPESPLQRRRAMDEMLSTGTTGSTSHCGEEVTTDYSVCMSQDDHFAEGESLVSPIAYWCTDLQYSVLIWAVSV